MIRSSRRAPVLAASLGLHLGVACLLAVRPRRWRRLLPVLVADHALVVAAGLLPRCSLLGPNLTRLPDAADEVALTFDDGPDESATPAVLDLLKATGARASFFPVGRRAARLPELVRRTAAEGHTVENHTWGHRAGFSFLSPRAMGEEIDRAQQHLERLSGRPPAWFRPPAGIRNPWLEPLLARRGLQLVSWTRRGYDAVDANPVAVCRRLLSGLRAGDVLLLHDHGRSHRGRQLVLEVLPRILDALSARGLRAVALPR